MTRPHLIRIGWKIFLHSQIYVLVDQKIWVETFIRPVCIIRNLRVHTKVQVQVQATTIWRNISQNLLRRRSWMHKSRFFLKDHSIFLHSLKFIKQPNILKIRLFKKVTTFWQNLLLKFDIYYVNLNFTVIQKLKISLQKEILFCLLYMILLGEKCIFFLSRSLVVLFLKVCCRFFWNKQISSY